MINVFDSLGGISGKQECGRKWIKEGEGKGGAEQGDGS
jgi:hypothetical protein